MSPIFDAWIQHPTPEFIGQPMFETLRRWMGIEEIPDALPIEMTLGIMDAAEVDRAAICAWYGPQGPIITNDQVADWVDAHPERFVGIGSVDLRRPMDAVAEVRRCVDELGFRGIRLLPWLWDLPPDDRRYYPVYVACVELDVPFCLQVGHTGPQRTSEWGRPIPYLDHVALDFPDLTIVGGHIGYPWTQEMIALATKYPNVYIDTSAYKPSRYPAELVHYMTHHGSEKVLFGTNYPMITPDACLAQLDELGLTDEQRDNFLWSNAARVFGVDAGASD